MNSEIPPEVRAAITRCVELVEAFEKEEARGVFDELSARVAGDRELAIATHRALANALSEAALDAVLPWRAALAAAVTDTTPRGHARWLDLAIEAAVSLADGMMDDEADEVSAELAARTSHDPALALATRLRLVEALQKAWVNERAIRELRALLELDLTDGERLSVLRSLASAHRGGSSADQKAEHARVLGELGKLLTASSTAPIELRVRAHLEIAYGDATLALHHAAIAADLAAGSPDARLRRLAVGFHAEKLFDAGELARAEALVIALPAPAPPEAGDEERWRELGARALLEHIRRRRGTLAEPPPEAFAEPAREVGEGPTLPEGFAAFFTPADDELSLIRAQGLVAADRVREWSHGRIATSADLESEKIFGPLRSYACRCGRFLGNAFDGIVCHRCGVEVIRREQRAVRPAHLVLSRPVAHPWFIPVIARVLDLTQAAVKALEPAELLRQLGEVHLGSLAEQLRDEAQRSSPGRRAALTPRLAIVETMTESNVRPEWCVLEVLPVWPPEAALPAPLELVALRSCYVELLEATDPTQAVRRLFNCFTRGRG